MIAPNGQSTAVSHAIDDTDKAVAPDTEPSENSEQTPGDANLRDSDIKVHLRGLNFFYNDTHALHDITLGLEKNQATAFIGPSGCGKSTLLRCINRIYELYPKRRATGEIIIDGRNILAPNEDLNQLRARVGMVFQKPTPFPMTIFDNIAFGVRLYERLPAARLRERVEWALHKANLWDEVKDRMNHFGTALSGGQQQRLCIARMIAVKPDVMLMDEPASALDPLSTLKIEELIDELKAEYTIAIVTHNMQQAARISKYTAFIYLGELVEFGRTSTIFTNPRMKQTGDYVSGRFG